MSLPMTLPVGNRSVFAVLIPLLLAGAGAAGYKLGADSKDVAGAVKVAESRAFERGRAQGDQEGRKALVDQDNSPEQIRSNTIDWLGYDDWKEGWYVVHMFKHTSLQNERVRVFSINERQKMDGGLSYSLCGKSNDSICYTQ